MGQQIRVFSMSSPDAHQLKLNALPPDLVDNETAKALREVGTITPVYDQETRCWVFEHPAYRLEAHGDTPEECVETYRLWMRDFIQERLIGNLAANVEDRSPGNAGRPKHA